MSLKHFIAVRDFGLLKGAAYAVAFMLAARPNKFVEAWPGLTRIADEARICKRAARKAVREMERRGLTLTRSRLWQTTDSSSISAGPTRRGAFRIRHRGTWFRKLGISCPRIYRNNQVP